MSDVLVEVIDTAVIDKLFLGIKVEQARRNYGHNGASQEENPKWVGMAVQEFPHPRNKKDITPGPPGVYPTLFDWVNADCGLKQISGRLGYSEITQKSGGLHFSWKPPLNC